MRKGRLVLGCVVAGMMAYVIFGIVEQATRDTTPDVERRHVDSLMTDLRRRLNTAEIDYVPREIDVEVSSTNDSQPAKAQRIYQIWPMGVDLVFVVSAENGVRLHAGRPADRSSMTPPIVAQELLPGSSLDEKVEYVRGAIKAR